jgi:O-antigen/teichoic acid export membrane protein
MTTAEATPVLAYSGSARFLAALLDPKAVPGGGRSSPPVSLTRKIALNATALGVGRFVMAGIGVVSVGVATRYLHVEAYGAFATATAFIAVLGGLTDVGLWTIGAREIAKHPEETRRILGSILTVGLVLSVAAGAIGVAVALVMYSGADNELTRRGILLLMLTVPLAAPAGAANAYFISQQKAYVGSITSVLASVVTIGLLVLAVKLDWGFTGIVIAYLAAAAVQGILLVILMLREVVVIPSPDLALGRKLFVWALPLGAAVLVHTLYWRLDLILLSLLKSKAEVALYAVPIKVVEAVIVLPSFIMITLTPELARLTREPVRFDQIVQKAFFAMQVGAVAVFVLFVAFAGELMRLVAGSEFAGSTVVLQILMVAVLFIYLGAVLGEGFVAHNRQGQLLWAMLALLVANVALNLALIPLAGARGAAAAGAVSEAFHFLALAWLYRRFASLPRLYRQRRVLLAACVMGSVALVKLLPFAGAAGPAVVLAVGGTLSLAVFAGALYALRAMPEEVHTGIVVPLWAWLKSPSIASRTATRPERRS